jgi:NADH-quinone oxidoreductase subunit A
MYHDFAVVGIFLLFGLIFIGVNLFVGKLLRPSKPSPEKGIAYECGEDPVGTPWIRFNNRFYLVGLVFIIFEVEVAAILPVAVVLKERARQGTGGVALAELLLFAGILFLGLVYTWVKGNLEWVRPRPGVAGKGR